MEGKLRTLVIVLIVAVLQSDYVQSQTCESIDSYVMFAFNFVV